MRTFAAALLGAIANASSLETKFMEWIAEHGRSYGTIEEFRFRQAQFATADAQIEEHNATNGSYTLGHNRVSDWTTAEYKRLLGYKASLVPRGPATPQKEMPNAATVDWVSAGAVTPVKDQGQCGSCWSFSSTGGMEGSYQISGRGALTSFSEQQLVSCVTLCFGCNGGNFTTVYQRYANAGNGNNDRYTEASWPYTATNGSCAPPSGGVTVANSTTSGAGATLVTVGSQSALKTQLNSQPVSVAIEADKFAFQAYKTGVFDNTSCGTNLDHAVLLVGYGNENGQDYYMMKNSWGTSWGESGYMKMAMIGDGDGICGVQMDPVAPIMS